MEKKSIIHAFLCGGVISAIIQIITRAFIAAGVTHPLALGVGPVYVMILLAFILYMCGVYQKLTKNGAMGAMLPITGLVSGIADWIYGARQGGAPKAEATREAVKGIGMSLVYGLIAAFIFALLAKLVA